MVMSFSAFLLHWMNLTISCPSEYVLSLLSISVYLVAVHVMQPFFWQSFSLKNSSPDFSP
eukprot:1555685-Heterocapsa_arctica.AAC.1